MSCCNYPPSFACADGPWSPLVLLPQKLLHDNKKKYMYTYGYIHTYNIPLGSQRIIWQNSEMRFIFTSPLGTVFLLVFFSEPNVMFLIIFFWNNLEKYEFVVHINMWLNDSIKVAAKEATGKDIHFTIFFVPLHMLCHGTKGVIKNNCLCYLWLYVRNAP